MSNKICLFFLFFSALFVQQAFTLPNPAAVYCDKMGYEYKTIQTPEGARGIVIVGPGVEYDAWDFFKGKVGQKYSFGALCGYDTECVRTNIDGYMVEYNVCVSRVKGVRKEGERIPLTDLMEQKGLFLFDETVKAGKKSSIGGDVRANRDEDMLKIYEVMGEAKQIPASFDWRTNSNHSYIGPIRDQGSCGSCYAFAANAAAECTYNWAMGKYDSNCVDFSESYIIWCLGRLAPYSSHFYGCDGADYDYYELSALVTNGVTLDSYFPYTESDPGSCTHWSDPVTTFASWHRVPCGDVDAIKTAIMTYGVVDAAVLVTTDFQNYISGIFTNTSITCSTIPCYYTAVNHAIGLVGWDDNPPEGGGGCWILRNSWDTSWGENGYMRIRYTSARVACEATYFIYFGTNTHSLAVTSPYGNAWPPVGVVSNNHGASMACYMTDSPVTSGTTQFVCAGWTGSGSVPATGTDTNTGTFSLNSDSTIAWLWHTNFYLGMQTNGNGSVDVIPGWKMLSSNMAVTATPACQNIFYGWSGDTGGCSIAGSTIRFVMDRARSITANFSSNSASSVSSGVCADYDGDGKGDPAVYDEPTGTWKIKLSGSGYYLLITTLNGLGGPGYYSVSADYDGDRLADPAVYHESSGIWTILKSSSDYSVWVFPQALGGTGYSGMPADYDGDQLADPGVYQCKGGNWNVLLSSAEYSSVEQLGFLGGTGYLAVAADYDGDGKGDPAVYGENNGYWIFRLSSIGYLEIVLTQPLGGTGYVPVQADYDGDGKADPAVRSEYGNEWIVMFSSGGYQPVQLIIQFDSM
ncbi:C1 family peptidase [Verrucomicrobiota bacterium]